MGKSNDWFKILGANSKRKAAKDAKEAAGKPSNSKTSKKPGQKNSLKALEQELDDIQKTLSSAGMSNKADVSGGKAPQGVGDATRPIPAPMASGGSIAQNLVNRINQASAPDTQPRAPISVMDREDAGFPEKQWAGWNVASIKKVPKIGSVNGMKSIGLAKYGAAADTPQVVTGGRVYSKSPYTGEVVSHPVDQSTLPYGGFSVTKIKSVPKIGKIPSIKAVSLADYAKEAETAPSIEGDGGSSGGGGAPSNGDGNSPKKGQAGGGRFKAFRIFHALSTLNQISSNALPINDPVNQIGPGAAALTAIGGLAGGPIGSAAYAGAAMLHMRQSGENAETGIARAEYQMRIGNIKFGNDRQYARDSMWANDNAIRGQTVFQYAQDLAKFQIGSMQFAPLGNSGITENAAANLARTVQAREKMRGETSIYSNEASKALSKYARDHKISLWNIPDNVKSQIIDSANTREVERIKNTKEFQAAVDDNMPTNLYGADKEAVRDALERKFADEITLDPEGSKMRGIKSQQFTLNEIDKRVRDYLAKHPEKMERLEATGRNMELKAKAERHRHLAEF